MPGQGIELGLLDERQHRQQLLLELVRRAPRLLDEAARLAERMSRERSAWSEPFAPLIRAAIAVRRGDTAAAVTLLRGAAVAFEAADMRLYGAATRRRIGELVGGEEGSRLVADADEFMTGQRIVRPERIVAVLAPGFAH